MICINKNSVNDVNNHIDQLTFLFYFMFLKQMPAYKSSLLHYTIKPSPEKKKRKLMLVMIR